MPDLHVMLPELVSPTKRTQFSQVSDMLESYEREIRSLEGSLLEAEENLDNTRLSGLTGSDLPRSCVC
jgi:flagellar biosynthesis chaperone FliJ